MEGGARVGRSGFEDFRKEVLSLGVPSAVVYLAGNQGVCAFGRASASSQGMRMTVGSPVCLTQHSKVDYP